MITLQGWKKCPPCQETLELRLFLGRRRNGRIEPQSYCRACQRKYLHEYNQRNRLEHNARHGRNRHRYRQRNRERVLEHLQTNPCVDCGERDVAVLEFDHVETKFENVSRLIAIGSSWSTLSAEIAKCVVRCANCHRRRTARQFSWWRGTNREPGCSSAW
jgi:hypothetical protein